MASSNPFYFGYYPGDRPLFKRPSGGRRFDDNPEANFLELDRFMYQLEKDTDIPAWFLERIRKDFEATLKAQIKPQKEVSQEALELYGEEAIDDLPGAFGIEISMNPKDWLKDPKKQAASTLTKWYKAAADWDDFDARNREALWGQVLSGQDHFARRTSRIPYISELDQKIQRDAAASIAQRLDGSGAAGAAGTAANPLNLDNQGVYGIKGKKLVPVTDALGNLVVTGGTPEYETVTDRYDAYGQLKRSVLSFQVNSRNVISRENKYDDIIKDAANALKFDLLTANPTTTAHNLEAQVFMKKLELHKAITDVSGKSGVKGIQDSLDRYLLTKNPKHAPQPKNISDALNATRKAKEFIASLDGTPEGDRIKKELGESVLNPFRVYVNDLEKYLRPTNSAAEVASIASSLSGGTPSPTQHAELHIKAANARNSIVNVGSQGNVLGRGGLGGGDLFNRGVERRVLRNIEQTIRDPNSTAFQDAYTNNSRKLRTIFRRLEQEREYAATEEFVRAFEGKRLMNVYLWPRLKNRFEVYTPAYWSNKVLDRTNRFGLVMQNDLVDDTGVAFGALRGVKVGPVNIPAGFKISNTSPFGAAALKPFENKFDVKFDHNGRKINGKLLAGSHFTTIATTGKWLEDGSLSPEAFSYMFHYARMFQTEKEWGDFYLDLVRANGGNPLPFGKASDLKEYVENFDKFRDWLRKNNKSFGMDQADVYNSDFASDFIRNLYHKKSLDPNALPITKKYVGLLEKVASKLNYLQNKVFGSRGGVLIRDTLSLKTIIGNKVADAISRIGAKIFAGFVTGATGGVGGTVATAVSALARKVIYVAVIKTLDTASAIGKAFLKGDFSGLVESWDKTFDYTAKIMLYAVALPMGCFVGIILLLGGMFVTAIPQTNPIAEIGGAPEAPLIDSEGGIPGVPPGGGWSSAGTYKACGYREVDVSQLNGCVFDGGYVIYQRSYIANRETDSRHGSNRYWDLPVIGDPNCRYSIPAALPPYPRGPLAALAPLNYCISQRTVSSVYGYALDAAPSGNNCATVFLPDMSSQGVVSWQVGRSGAAGNGNWITATGLNSGSDQVVKLILMHTSSIAYPGDGKSSGEAAAELYNWVNNQHIHIELSILEGNQWVVKRPEDYICR